MDFKRTLNELLKSDFELKGTSFNRMLVTAIIVVMGHVTNFNYKYVIDIELGLYCHVKLSKKINVCEKFPRWWSSSPKSKREHASK